MNPLRNDLSTRIAGLVAGATDGRLGHPLGHLAVGSVKGPHRDKNEDRAIVAEIAIVSGQPLRLALVCDGLGGMAAGEEASALAATTFVVSLALSEKGRLPDRLRAACLEANQAVFSEYNGKGGTTLTAVAITAEQGFFVHAGDSRLYSVEPDGSMILESRDDTVSGVIAAQSGGAGEDNLDNRLLQFIGIGDALEPHLFPIEIGEPRIFMVTSDGAHGLGRKALSGLVARIRSPLDLVRKLTMTVDALGVDDNASVASINNLRWDLSRSNYSGRRLSIWSPSDHVEIWLPDLEYWKPAPHTDKPLQETVGKSSRTPAQPKKIGGARRLKTHSRRKKAGDEDRKSPPMEVLFQVIDGKSDD